MAKDYKRINAFNKIINHFQDKKLTFISVDYGSLNTIIIITMLNSVTEWLKIGYLSSTLTFNSSYLTFDSNFCTTGFVPNEVVYFYLISFHHLILFLSFSIQS